MKAAPNLAVERFRVRDGRLASSRFDGNNGAFLIPLVGRSRMSVSVAVIASDGMGWDHVSVSLKDRCPTWEEMCLVKDLFFEPDQCVMQLHPRRSEYVNYHEFCLHLWRPQDVAIPEPDSAFVGPKSHSQGG